MNTGTPLACDMNVFTSAERELHVRNISQLFQKIENVQDAENGYKFIFPDEAEIIPRLAEFIAKERMCCPFLEFNLMIMPGRLPISLRLTGPAGAQEFLRAEFSEAFP